MKFQFGTSISSRLVLRSVSIGNFYGSSAKLHQLACLLRKTPAIDHRGNGLHFDRLGVFVLLQFSLDISTDFNRFLEQEDLPASSEQFDLINGKRSSERAFGTEEIVSGVPEPYKYGSTSLANRT